MDYFFDTYSIIELAKDSPSYSKFKHTTVITSALDLTETHYFFIELLNEKEADKIVSELDLSLTDIDAETAIDASKFRHKNKKLKMSYADCLGYCIAKKNNLIFVTGDDAFKEMENVEFVK